MKKLMLMTALAVFGLFNANAQEFTFGAKAGVNFANFGGDDADDLDGRTAFHVGGVANFGISELFSVQPELLYSAQGVEQTFEGVTGKVQVDYLNLPVLAKFMVADGLSIEAGPQVGFLLSAKAKGGEETRDITDELKGTDFSGVIGLGYQMESGLNFGARYNLGFSNIAEINEVDLKNNVIQVSVGFMF
ncbi:porin family protein [Gelidibacter maritimus]|uniref:PorT family protein n=1 Tax=Gelidibacter maritimus TaxID=2761487 RepID=A0A7W2R372_9FLAO|nr:porin family protein [Gelidibacter maritimus]MBA6152561.1 PorT family protein [Gelidibacter maritimus]